MVLTVGKCSCVEANQVWLQQTYSVFVVLVGTCTIFHLNVVKLITNGLLGSRVFSELTNVIPDSQSQNYKLIFVTIITSVDIFTMINIRKLKATGVVKEACKNSVYSCERKR
jgi:hypothetical protein